MAHTCACDTWRVCVSHACARIQAALQERTKQLEESQESAAQLKERILRTLADMENLRTRTNQQLEESRQFAVQSFAKDVLDVADNLERALDSVPAELLSAAEPGGGEADPATLRKNLQSLHGGVAMSHKVRGACRPLYA